MNEKLNHTNLCMGEISSFVEKIRPIFIIKKKMILICQNIRFVLVGMWRKVVFGDKNPDLCCDDKKKWF